MSFITKHFVTNNNIPDFVKADHELFSAFIEAYYEWIEQQNDSETSSLSEVYKAVGNPGYIATHQELLVEIDETIDQFVDFFAHEVVPISLEGMKTNPRFFIKKIRELYLAKGTEKSFKLFFKLYYDENIDVFETRDNVLRASDGKYFAFPTAHLLVVDNQENASKIDYVLASLYDSDRAFVATLVSGLVIDDIGGASVIKVNLSTDIQLNSNESYFVVDTNDNELEIEVSPLLTISNLTIRNPGYLFEEKDKIFIESNELKKKFSGSVSSVKQGYVEGLKVRNRGVGYQTTDAFELKSGSIGFGTFQPTKVSKNGQIEEIQGIPLRTGNNNTGFNSTVLVDASVPLINNALVDTLPNLSYLPAGTTYALGGLPYGNTGSRGYGFQGVPFSTSIGQVTNILLSESTYFAHDSDVVINTPTSILLDNMDLKVGDKVSFQLFDENVAIEPSGFDDDSEEMRIVIRTQRVWDHIDSDGTQFDSENERVVTFNLPIGWDSENHNWRMKEIKIDTNVDSDLVWQPLLDWLDSEGANISYTFKINNGPTTIDGGEPFNATMGDSDIDGGDSFGFKLDSDIDRTWIDGGPYFSFARSFDYTIEIKFNGQYFDQLEPHHFEGLANDIEFVNSFDFVRLYHETKGMNIINVDGADIGDWKDTGYFGEVISVDASGQVAKVVSITGSPLMSDSDFRGMTADKYELMIATPFDEDGFAPSYHGLPLKNVVLQFSKLELDYELGTVSTLAKRFWTQDGFISSDYGGTLQDNFFYSDYSYRIRSKLPFAEWKEKFKTMLHPAGLVLSSEYLSNSNVQSPNDFGVATYNSDNFGSYLTFDMMNEAIYPIESGVNADNVFYATNAFEYLNSTTNSAVSMDASIQTNPINPRKKQQSGNAWWDYEPSGWTYAAPLAVTVTGTYQNLDPAVEFFNKFSTQDSDSEGYVANNYHYYNKFNRTSQDFFKTNSRQSFPGNQTIRVVKTQFEDGFMTKYSMFDTALPSLFVQTFSDSEGVSFKSPDYTKVKTDPNQYFPMYDVPRQAELMIRKERDLFKAMQESKLLTWVEADKTYYDFDAYERKWNQINTLRDFNNEGYIIKVAPKYEDYPNLVSRSKRRNKSYDFLTEDQSRYFTTNIPYTRDTWERGYLVFDKDPLDQINSIKPLPVEEPESKKDPRELMRGRRG